MAEPIMIGTRGWSEVAPSDDFYPPELPADWRLSFYSNNLRSVLVPQELWAVTSRTDVVQWLEDSDPAFRFVLELPAPLSAPLTQAKCLQELEFFLDRSEPIAPRVAGYLLRVTPDTALDLDWLENFLNRLVALVPVCVDLPQGPWRTAPALAVISRQGAGVCWHCASEFEPSPGGRLRLALAAPSVPRVTRRYIEQLVQWQGQDAQAGLFFTAAVGATKAAHEARLIAELMGV